MPEVVVVGGSIAGAAAALELARLGRDVLLVERAKLPRRNPCGEGLSSLGVSLIDRLGLSAQISSKPHFPFNHFAFVCNGKRLLLPLGHGRGLGVERSVLDEFFYDALMGEPLVQSRYGVAVTGIYEEENGCKVVLKSEDAQGATDLARPDPQSSTPRYGALDCEEVRCKFVILACGAGNPLLRPGEQILSEHKFRKHSLSSAYSSASAADSGAFVAPSKITNATRALKNSHTSTRYGLSQTLVGRFTKEVDGVTIYLQPASAKGNSEIYCTRVSPNRLNISLLGDRLYFQNHRRALVDVEAICAELGFSGEVDLPPHGSGPFTSAHNREFHPNSHILPIGDACQVFDPAGGMGMTHALLSAAVASRTINGILTNPNSVSKLLGKYRRQQLLTALPLNAFTGGVCFGVRLISRYGLPFKSQRLPLADWSEVLLRVGGTALVGPLRVR